MGVLRSDSELMASTRRDQQFPIPKHVREQLPEWGPAMRAVRRALKRGSTSEAAIGYATDLDAWTVRASLELLALVGEVELARDARWRGLTLDTARYGGAHRKRLQAEES